MFARSLVPAVALCVGVGGHVRAQPTTSVSALPEPAAPVVDAWHPFAAEPTRLASGWALTLDVGGGASHSPESIAPVVNEGLGVGMFVSSTDRHAWSLELVEAANLVVDHTTPQFGLVGIGVRHAGRPEDPLFGAPGTIDFHRLAAGVAMSYDGRQLAAGLGLEASVAYLVRGSSGVSVKLGGYIFDTSQLSRDTLVVLTVGYVFSPVRDRPYAPPQPPVPGRDQSRVCHDLPAYRDALTEARKQVPEACKDAGAPECQRIRERVRVLAEGFNSCQLGKDVGPPPTTRDAP